MRPFFRLLTCIVALALLATFLTTGMLRDHREATSPAFRTVAQPDSDAAAATESAPSPSLRLPDSPRVAASKSPTVEAARDSSPEGGSRRVRSAHGIPLEALQYTRDSEDWNDANGDHIPREAQRVRARGHPAVAVEPGTGDIALSADALLELTCPGLGAAATSLDLEARFGEPRAEQRAAAVWIALDADKLAAAVDLSRWPERRTTAHLAVNLRSGGAIFIDWTLSSGDRQPHELELEPAELAPEAAPLRVRERAGSGGETDTMRRIRLRMLGESGSRLLLEAPGITARLQTRFVRFEAQATRNVIEIDRIPVGQRYVVTLLRDDGWYGRTTFRHDGAGVDVDLIAPVHLVGRIVNEEGQGLAGVRLLFRFHRDSPEGREAVVWSTRESHATGDDGCISLLLPDSVPSDPASAHTIPRLPSKGELIADAEERERLRLPLTLPASGVVDLGDVLLPRRQADLVAPFGGVLDDAEWIEVRWRGTNGDVATPLVDNVLSGVGDERRLFIERDEFPRDSPPESLLVLSPGRIDGLMLESAGPPARYRVAPGERLHVEFDPSALRPIPERWSGVLRWSQVPIRLDHLLTTDDASPVRRGEWILPREGIEWTAWLERGRRPEGAAVHVQRDGHRVQVTLAPR